MTPDEDAYRAQLGYLFARSPFYAGKLAAAGFADADAAGGLADVARLPLTTKQELRATVTDAQPFGAHLAADPGEIVRIYSTSGTTGAPSYIPLTAQDLDNWITGSPATRTRRTLEPAFRERLEHGWGARNAGSPPPGSPATSTRSTLDPRRSRRSAR